MMEMDTDTITDRDGLLLESIVIHKVEIDDKPVSSIATDNDDIINTPLTSSEITISTEISQHVEMQTHDQHISTPEQHSHTPKQHIATTEQHSHTPHQEHSNTHTPEQQHISTEEISGVTDSCTRRRSGRVIKKKDHYLSEDYVQLDDDRDYDLESSSSQRMKHKLRRIKQKSSSCKHCRRKFKKHSSLHKHLLKHSDCCKHVNKTTCSEYCVTSSSSATTTTTTSTSSGDNGPPYTCNLCQLVYITLDSLHNHLQEHCTDINSSLEEEGHHHDNNLLWSVDSSETGHDQLIDDKSVLTENKRTESNNVSKIRKPVVKTKQCSTCGALFPCDSALSRHMKLHDGIKSWVCQVCDHAFSEQCFLRQHLRVHSGERPFVCSLCGRAFNRSTLLRYHERMHTGERPYKCKVCGQGFARSNYLYTHMRTHTGELPYECVTCGQRFAQRGSLTKHWRVHSGETPYICQMCGRCFTQSSSLNRHFLRLHASTADNVNTCPLCDASFKSEIQLTQHVKTHHQD